MPEVSIDSPANYSETDQIKNNTKENETKIEKALFAFVKVIKTENSNINAYLS